MDAHKRGTDQEMRRMGNLPAAGEGPRRRRRASQGDRGIAQMGNFLNPCSFAPPDSRVSPHDTVIINFLPLLPSVPPQIAALELPLHLHW